MRSVVALFDALGTTLSVDSSNPSLTLSIEKGIMCLLENLPSSLALTCAFSGLHHDGVIACNIAARPTCLRP